MVEAQSGMPKETGVDGREICEAEEGEEAVVRAELNLEFESTGPVDGGIEARDELSG